MNTLEINNEKESSPVEEIKSSGGYSWECQRSFEPKIQKLIDNGLWFDRFEKDLWGRTLAVMELYGASEGSINSIGDLVYVQHTPKVTILKFKI